MKMPLSLNMLCDSNITGIHKVLNMREYAPEHLNMFETEPKITVQAK